jgi:hypothetical protein
MGSLVAATAPGPGSTIDLGGVRKRFQMIWSSTGNPTSVQLHMEGSVDATTWVTLVPASWPNASLALPAPLASASPGGTVTHLGGGYRYLRAVLDSLSGGSSPSVSAVVMPIGSGDLNT